jgi:hypothetical protein
MVALMLYRPSPLLILIAIASIPALRQAWNHDRDAPETRAYYAAPVAMRVEYGIFYLGLAAFLAVMTDATHKLIQTGTAG